MCKPFMWRWAGIRWAMIVLAAELCRCVAPTKSEQGAVGAMDASTETMESAVLVAAWREIAGEITTPKSEAGSKANHAPPEPLVNEARAAMPGVFRATAAQEREFAAGRFNDRANRTMLDALIVELNAAQVELPNATRYLMAQHRDGRLSGARLEFAVRLLLDQVDKLRAAATEPPPVSKK